MHAALAALAHAVEAATPSPTPSTVDPDLVTPTAVGFAVTALLAVAVILLVMDMMRRIRRGRVRADINEELEAIEQARAVEATETDDESIDPDEPGDRPRG